MKALLAAVSILALASGCVQQGKEGELILRDEQGRVVATGDLTLPRATPPTGRSFEGRWRLVSSEGSFPAEAVKGNTYRASVDGSRLSIDLSPGFADNNVLLTGTQSDGLITGDWSHSTFAGPRKMGTFTLRQP